MGFFKSSCRERWSAVTHRPVSKRGARMLDVTLLAPALALTGAFGKRLPKLVRYGLVSLGLGLFAWNAFDLIDDDEPIEHDEDELDRLRENGL